MCEYYINKHWNGPEKQIDKGNLIIMYNIIVNKII
jgi:hypothetical protein